MGEFLLNITLLQAAIYFVVNLIVLFLIARYKPEKYNIAYRISLAPILFVAVYRMGWSASATHHDISLGNQSQLLNFANGMIPFLILLHYYFFEKLAKQNMEEGKDEES